MVGYGLTTDGRRKQASEEIRGQREGGRTERRFWRPDRNLELVCTRRRHWHTINGTRKVDLITSKIAVAKLA